MKKFYLFFIALVVFAKAESMNIIEENIYCFKMTDFIEEMITSISRDIEEHGNGVYTIEVNKEISWIYSGKICNVVSKKYRDGSIERIKILSFHEDLNNEKKYTSLSDWYEKYKEDTLKDQKKQENFEIKIKIETIKTMSENDIIVLKEHTTTRKYRLGLNSPWQEETKRSEELYRMVYSKGRIFLVSRSVEGGATYTPEELEKWIKRLENISYLNEVEKFEDLAEKYRKVGKVQNKTNKKVRAR